mmetsp:Transcript_47756/g.93845  ORF Transcript_47756/g.93845 Transcript_47756/m.93845 type:complete len:222 (+) Transcript_47756:1103-1768(+)
MKKLVKVSGPGMLTDMYAYAMGAAHLNLPHTRLDHFMVSSVGGFGEGWAWVDKSIEDGYDPCASAWSPDTKGLVPNRLPPFIHYCHNFAVLKSDLMFHKGHVPADILDCDKPLLKLPPKDYLTKRLSPQQRKTFSSQPPKDFKKDIRSAWLLCMIFPRLYHATVEHKKKYCKDWSPDSGGDHFVLLQNDKAPHCPLEKEGKTCWPFAKTVPKGTTPDQLGW